MDKLFKLIKALNFLNPANLFRRYAADAILDEIDKLDAYKPAIAGLIRKYADPDRAADMAVEWVEARLRELVRSVLKLPKPEAPEQEGVDERR